MTEHAGFLTIIVHFMIRVFSDYFQEMDMVDFVAFLSLGGLVPATIVTYMSGVKHHLRIRGAHDFNDSFLLCLTW